jgi:hypothetical protein
MITGGITIATAMTATRTTKAMVTTEGTTATD